MITFYTTKLTYKVNRMKIYDITRELLSAPIYPGDKKPTLHSITDMNFGDLYNLSVIEMCVHNGTHIDAPKHFYKDGLSIHEVDLNKCIGACKVIELSGIVDSQTIKHYVNQDCKRYLLKGDIEITLDAAIALSSCETVLIGVEGLTVGPLYEPMEVHLELLRNEIIILENLDLTSVEPGEYMIYALPLKIQNADGAPCRVVLIEND